MTFAEMEREIQEDEHGFSEKQCTTFASILRNDLEALRKIERRSRDWEKSVRDGVETFRFEIDRRITETFQSWLERSELRCRQIEIQRKLGCDPEIVAEFEANVSRVKELFLQRKRAEAAAEARYHLVHGE